MKNKIFWKFLAVVFLVIVSFSVITKDCFCQQAQISGDFRSFLDAVNQHYIIPNGWTYDRMVTQYPKVLSIAIGHGLWQQMRYAEQDPSINARIESLKREARNYCEGIAQASNYKDADGTQVSGASLWEIAVSFMNSGADGYIWQNFHVQGGQMPCILMAQAPAGNLPEAQSRMEDETAIELMGHEAQGVNIPQQQPSAPRQQEQPLQPDDIVGTWTNDDQVSVRIWKEGDGYRGTVSYPWKFDPSKIVSGSIYTWVPDEVCIQLQYKDADRTMRTCSYSGKRYDYLSNGEKQWEDDSVELKQYNDGLRLQTDFMMPSFRKY